METQTLQSHSKTAESAKTAEAALKAPVVFDYLDPLKFLGDTFEWRKRFEPEFSYSAWSEQAGFRSRTYVRLMLLGKRQITDGSIHLLSRALKLKNQEAEYFATLVRFSQAKSLDEREAHLRSIQSLLKNANSNRRVHDKYQFLSSHLVPRVQVMLMLPDFRATVENLAREIKASEAKIREIVETLHSLGLASVKRNTNGEEVWSAKHEPIEVEDRFANVAIQSYHAKSLDEAKEALELPPEVRNFQALTLALTEEQYQQLSKELIEFLDAAAARFKPVEGQMKRIYQMNSHLIPLTRPLRAETRVSDEAPDQMNQGEKK
jgi:uncharacterized protein (TIGR02147 family)